ncbi:MAG: hypothetical protein QME60_07760 [Verrucomicrobiota bacterium]|nr:hypothetical protein [Verrucomicrobiota bacterium]
MKIACAAVIALALTAAIAGAQEKVFTIGMSQCNLGEPWRV